MKLGRMADIFSSIMLTITLYFGRRDDMRYMSMSDAVECAERVVADGDERSVGKIVEHLLAVDAEFYAEAVEKHAPHEFRSGGVAEAAVYVVDLVDR